MNLASIIDDHPDGHTALVAGGDRISYGRLRAEVAARRAVLVDLGLVPGDRVAVICATNPRFVRSWLAVLGIGGVAVPLNPRSPGPELQHQMAAVGARAAIVGPAGLAAFSSIDRSELPGLEHVLTVGGPGLPDSVDLTALAAAAAADPVGMVERADDDLAALLFTAGMAGSPKAARLTHGNLSGNLRQVRSHPLRVVRGDDVGVCVVPLHHVFGLNGILNPCLYGGATVVLVERFDPASLLQTIASEKVSLLVGPPGMWSAIVDLDPEPSALDGIRLALSGAAALPERVALAARLLGLPLNEGYGLTEAGPSVTVGTGDDVPVGSIGRPIGDVEVRLTDYSGADAAAGEPGEILVRGPNVFDGYWDDPAATAETLDADGWLHTGDIAVADPDGFLYLIDRIKDLIIVSGFNVHPGEVAAVLVAHPAVADAAVVGIPHPHTSEAVKAFVVASGDEEEIEEDELVEWCAARLARYKCPSKIDVVDEIPRGSAGDLLRAELAL